MASLGRSLNVLGRSATRIRSTGLVPLRGHGPEGPGTVKGGLFSGPALLEGYLFRQSAVALRSTIDRPVTILTVTSIQAFRKFGKDSSQHRKRSMALCAF